jgi:molecular chaperone DnaK
MLPILGIDLGTSNSCGAVVLDGKPVIIPNYKGERLTPSVVRILDTGEFVVGTDALRSKILDPINTITGIKRFIGRRYNEVMDLAQNVPFSVAVGKNELAVVYAHGYAYTPQEISASILRSIKEAAEAFLGRRIAQAVVTIPAYFGERPRTATIEAGRLAGLEVLRVLNEPTAAALAYGLTHRLDARVAVFDLGGGTFDISILEIGEGVLEVKSISGDGLLGGDDFDNCIIEWVAEEIRIHAGFELASDPTVMERVREEVVAAKCHLSVADTALINVPLPFLRQKNDKSYVIALKRSEFNQICDELFQRLITPCERALSDARLTPDEIQKVILVGGATRMQRIAQVVDSVFGLSKADRSINPDEAVGLGAAVQGAVFLHDVRETLLLDVTAKTLGLGRHDGHTLVMVPRNTTIPTRKSQVLSTSIDNQTSVEIQVLEGEAELIIENRTIGRLQLTEIPSVPKGKPQIEIIFDIDANNILNVSAKDLGTGKEQRITIRPGLTKEELERLRLDAELHAEKDRQTREAAKTRNDADSLAYQSEKRLQNIHGKLSPDQTKSLEDAIMNVRGMLKGNDNEAIKSALEALQNLTAKVLADF